MPLGPCPSSLHCSPTWGRQEDQGLWEAKASERGSGGRPSLGAGARPGSHCVSACFSSEPLASIQQFRQCASADLTAAALRKWKPASPAPNRLQERFVRVGAGRPLGGC